MLTLSKTDRGLDSEGVERHERVRNPNLFIPRFGRATIRIILHLRNLARFRMLVEAF